VSTVPVITRLPVTVKSSNVGEVFGCTAVPAKLPEASVAYLPSPNVLVTSVCHGPQLVPLYLYANPSQLLALLLEVICHP